MDEQMKETLSGMVKEVGPDDSGASNFVVIDRGPEWPEVVITGLTHAEARAFAQHFAQTAFITVAGVL